MFEFKSPDNESGKKRVKRFRQELIIYAMSKFNTKKQVAAYCGITTRALQNILRELPELSMSIKNKKLTEEEEWNEIRTGRFSYLN